MSLEAGVGVTFEFCRAAHLEPLVVTFQVNLQLLDIVMPGENTSLDWLGATFAGA